MAGAEGAVHFDAQGQGQGWVQGKGTTAAARDARGAWVVEYSVGLHLILNDK